MKLTKTSAIAALTISCAMVVGVGSVQAGTFLDFLKGNKAAQSPRQQQQNSFAGSLDDDLGAFPDPAQPAKALPKVTGPTYKTYRPDVPRLIAVSKFAPKLETASAAAALPAGATDDQTTASIQSAQPDFSSQPRAFMMDVKVKAPTEVASAIEKFYSSHDGLLWVDANGVTAKAKEAIAALAEVDKVGLDPADYAVTDPSDTFASVDSVTRQRQLMQFEIELSAATLSFIQDTRRGRIDPDRISDYYDFKRKNVNLDAALMNMAASTNIRGYLESRNPSNEQFEALKAELARIKGESGQGVAATVTIAPGTLIKPGDSNPELQNIMAGIQQRASDKFKLDHSVELASYSGGTDYTDDLVRLVKDFQGANGLTADGVIGKGTIRLLSGGDTSASKVDKIVYAMEELRWLPDDLGSRFVFINQPAFTAYYHNEGKEQFNMKVVVGSKAHQTFFFQDEIELVEFNPYWGVPRSIIVNEMLPKLRQDPSYLDRLGYETSINGQQVASSDIDWNQTDSVDVRQPPGGDNALGQLKIMFPNAHAIYMHDTPQKSFFKRDMRALSHGCVRLVDPKKMAAAVMNMSIDQINAEISTGQNKQVKVPQKFPVYVAYFTAFPDKDGNVQYFDDVYDRDTYLSRALSATSKVRHGES